MIGDFQSKISSTFKLACRKNQEVLDPPQLKLLVENIHTRLPDFDCIFTGVDAGEIHRALDGDGDGIITEIEFGSWILRGAALSYQERSKFSGKSALHKRMCNFLEAVCLVCGGGNLLHGLTLDHSKATINADSLTPEQLTAGLQMLFNQFDTDHSGNIDKNELKAMMIDLPLRFYVDPDTVPTPDDVDIVMNALDADASGEIDFEEWKNWVLGNRGMSTKQRAKFAAQSQSHFRLNGFVATLCKITADMSQPLGDDAQLREGLVMIFDQSSTSTGHIGPVEIYKMVNALNAQHPEIPGFECDMEMSKTISEALDSDGNGTIEVDEWVAWMIRGAGRPALERAKFAAHSATFMVLTNFLEAVSSAAKKLTVLKKH